MKVQDYQLDRLLAQHPRGLTALQIAALINRTAALVKYVLRRTPGVYISGWWQPARGRAAAVWSAGPGPDVLPPPKLDGAVLRQRKNLNARNRYARQKNQS